MRLYVCYMYMLVTQTRLKLENHELKRSHLSYEVVIIINQQFDSTTVALLQELIIING